LAQIGAPQEPPTRFRFGIPRPENFSPPCRFPARKKWTTLSGQQAQAFLSWRRTPPGERIQPLFRLKALLDSNLKEIARIITRECGKTLAESEAELKRGIENVEVAAGIPSLMMGATLEDIASGIDETMVRQPLGVVGIITPFNFPAMIPLWFLPYAVACGNTVVLKPSERTPMAMNRVCELLDDAGFPAGVVNLVHGGKDTVTAIIDHPDVRAISFVGSTAVARYVYGRAANNGKRAQCQGGARNPVVVLPDADMEMACRIIADAAFGCAGQRCLASSVAIAVGDAGALFSRRITEAAAARNVGNGLHAGVEMGPVISSQSRQRIEGLITQAVAGPAHALLDGRGVRVSGCEEGYFLRTNGSRRCGSFQRSCAHRSIRPGAERYSCGFARRGH
jgi:malonate-semialdehyde dehydrogenase (acetylating)/methylmalonate-semialdehyde dehydrogenase